MLVERDILGTKGDARDFREERNRNGRACKSDYFRYILYCLHGDKAFCSSDGTTDLLLAQKKVFPVLLQATVRSPRSAIE